MISLIGRRYVQKSLCSLLLYISSNIIEYSNKLDDYIEMVKTMFKGTLILTDSAVRAFVANPLSKAESLVLWELLSTIPVSGEVVSNAELSERLKVTRQRISPIMQHLCEIGFLIRGEKFGVSYHYKLNPSFIRVLNT